MVHEWKGLLRYASSEGRRTSSDYAGITNVNFEWLLPFDRNFHHDATSATLNDSSTSEFKATVERFDSLKQSLGAGILPPQLMVGTWPGE